MEGPFGMGMEANQPLDLHANNGLKIEVREGFPPGNFQTYEGRLKTGEDLTDGRKELALAAISASQRRVGYEMSATPSQYLKTWGYESLPYHPDIGGVDKGDYVLFSCKMLFPGESRNIVRGASKVVGIDMWVRYTRLGKAPDHEV